MCKMQSKTSYVDLPLEKRNITAIENANRNFKITVQFRKNKRPFIQH